MFNILNQYLHAIQVDQSMNKWNNFNICFKNVNQIGEGLWYFDKTIDLFWALNLKRWFLNIDTIVKILSYAAIMGKWSSFSNDLNPLNTLNLVIGKWSIVDEIDSYFRQKSNDNYAFRGAVSDILLALI